MDNDKKKSRVLSEGVHGTIKCSMFIVPNDFATIEDDVPMLWHRSSMEQVYGEAIVSSNTHFVEVWMHCKDYDNWGDHGAPFVMVNPQNKSELQSFPAYIPYSLVKDSKEGDVIITNVGGQIININDDIHDSDIILEITCRQKGSRYPEYGTFHETLTTIVQVTDGL